MKPAAFAYADPTTIDEAVALLAEHGDDAAVLAGGQSLVPLMNLRLARPSVVIDLRRITELSTLDRGPAGVRAGAMAGITTLAEQHPNPGVGEAIQWIGHPQIRARTTVGGTIAHADPAAELPAVLLALDGTVELTSSSGTRSVSAAEWFDGSFSTTRRPDELVVAVNLPTLDGPNTWLELARRRGDFALVGLFLGRHDSAWRVACSGVGSTPVRATRCEAALAGGDLQSATAELMAELAPDDDLHSSAAHRRALAATLLSRAFHQLEPDKTATAA